MHKTKHKSQDAQAGYTLMELLVTLSIMAVLIAIISPQIMGYLGRAKRESAIVQMKNIEAALDLYYLDMGAYPTSEEGLSVLWTKPENDSNWHGPYLRVKNELQDPWGEAFHYKSPGDHGTYDLLTLSADKALGGDGEAADVANW